MNEYFLALSSNILGSLSKHILFRRGRRYSRDIFKNQ